MGSAFGRRRLVGYLRAVQRARVVVNTTACISCAYTLTLMETEAYTDSSSDCKKIETLLGEAKHVLSMVRLR